MHIGKYLKPIHENKSMRKIAKFAFVKIKSLLRYEIVNPKQKRLYTE